MYIDLNGATYAYEIQGEGEPLVLLHGFTSQKETWDQLVKIWKSDFQVITIDLPGHGQTKVDYPRTMGAVCDDLATIFLKLNIKKTNLLGYSMGGRTALSFALTYPDLVQTLMLESASPGLATAIERAERRKNDAKIIKRLEKRGIHSFVEFWENIPLFATQKQLPEGVQKQIQTERLSQSALGLSESLRYMGTGEQPSWWHDLTTFTKPVLLITGQRDKKFVTINREMLNLFPKAKMKVIDQAGHTVHIERPKEFAKVITQFLHNK